MLTVQPLAILCRIPTQNATDAQFTPDSREVLFVSSVSHVKEWSIANHARVSLRDLPLQKCAKEPLSPDGRSLACVDAQGTLRLVDVGPGKTVLQREEYVPKWRDSTATYEMGPSSATQLRSLGSRSSRLMLDPSLARVGFSPDGRFFLAAPALAYNTPKEVSGTVLAWDIRAKREVRLGGLRDLRMGDSIDYSPGLQYFVFVAPDRVMISSMLWARRGVVTARLVAFPSGQLLSKCKLRPGPLFQAADHGFVIVHPFAHYPLSAPPFEVLPGVNEVVKVYPP